MPGKANWLCSIPHAQHLQIEIQAKATVVELAQPGRILPNLLRVAAEVGNTHCPRRKTTL
jgi:hypothetical protein